MQATELKGLEFGPKQQAMFAPLSATLEVFAEEHGLLLSRVFDGYDPIMPHCCYFLVWTPERCRGCFIRVCSHELFTVGETFTVSARGRTGKHYYEWEYAASDGAERLRTILDAAFQSFATGHIFSRG